MGEPRHGVSERPEQEDVLGRVGEVVLTADDVADLHGRVVDDDGEVVQRRAVRPDDDEIAAEVGHVDLDPSAHDVVEGDDALTDAEAQDRAPALGLALGPFVGRQVRAATDVAGRQLGRLERLAIGGELLGRAVAGIRLVPLEEPRGGRRVAGQALHLAVGRVRTARFLAGHLGTLVPAQAQPVQAVEDVLLIGDRATDLVGVLEAQDERAADVPGMEEVEERRARRPDVERPGGAGRDPDAGLLEGGHPVPRTG